MKKTIYLVSDTSYSEGGLYNHVHSCNTKKEAIESANAYIDEANENVKEEFKCNKNFDEYDFGYKEIEINDYHNGYDFIISITEEIITI